MRRIAFGIMLAVGASVPVVTATSGPVPSFVSAKVLTATEVRLSGQPNCPPHGRCRYEFRWSRAGDAAYTAVRVSPRRHGRAVALTVRDLQARTRYEYSLCVARRGQRFECFGPAGRPSGSFTTSWCNRYAAPGGRNRAPGTIERPLRTITALELSLTPGQTGCLQSGYYGSIHTWHDLPASGTPNGQITIMAGPRQHVQVTGLISLEGAYTTLKDLTIDGSNDFYRQRRPGTSCPWPVSLGLEIDGDHDVFANNDLYQSVAKLRGNGIGIGWNRPADDVVIRSNRIHDVGQCQAYDHLIYLSHGDGVQIYDNWMWNDPHGFGVQLYPAPSDAHIYANVIDHAGSGFVLGGSATVANNTIDHNIVINSTGLPNAGLRRGVGVSSCCAVGANNAFTNNVIFRNPGGIVGDAAGLKLSDNTTANPNLTDPTKHDYTLIASSPHRAH